MSETYLLLGSNQGNRENYLIEACKRLKNLVGNIVVQSGIYETAAWGLEDQPAFLNQVLVFDTSLTPETLLKTTQDIELDLGRNRDIKWGARVIDVDILFYDDLIINSKELIIPHPHLHKRRFTLVPLAEIRPNFNHPVLNQSIKDLLVDCPDKLEVKFYA